MNQAVISARRVGMDSRKAGRRPLLRGLGAVCLLGGMPLSWSSRAVGAGGYPARAVQVINTFPPGGPSDILARLCSEYLHQSFGQPFVVENRAGASGNIGAQAVANARPDGQTLMIGIDSTLTINPHIYRQPGFVHRRHAGERLFPGPGRLDAAAHRAAALCRISPPLAYFHHPRHLAYAVERVAATVRAGSGRRARF